MATPDIDWQFWTLIGNFEHLSVIFDINQQLIGHFGLAILDINSDIQSLTGKFNQLLSVIMVEDTAQQSDRVSAAAVLQFAAREAREGRRFAEFGAHAFASITYNAYGNFRYCLKLFFSLKYL